MNSASWLFLLVSLWGAWFAYNALVPQRRGTYLATWSWLSGWLTGDLAFHHVAWQAVATAIFAGFGAFETFPGQLGLAVTGAAWLALAWTHVRSGKTTALCEAALREGLVADGETPNTAIVASLDPDRASPARAFARIALAIPSLPDSVERIQYSRAAGLDLHLDVYRPRNPSEDCPVLFQIHGGAWMVGTKDHQALPLMHRLASNGWGASASTTA